MKATILDLRYRMKDVLKAVERGETVTVLYRGKEKACILPAAGKPTAASLDAGEAFGLWKDREDLRDVPGYLRRLRQGRFRAL
jgi:prevent-host-death family protein